MNKKRLCCFYVNDIHLITMLLPYINERINEDVEIITMLESDISESAKKVMDCIQGEKSDNLLNVDWEEKELNYLYNCNINNKLILINGSDDYIKEANEIINSREEKCSILNCYEMTQWKDKLEEILNKHDKVVNTSGEKYPEEVFADYTQNNYKKITL